MDAPPTTLSTERLVLRPWVEGDADALAAAVTASVEHLRPWMPWIADEPRTRTQRLETIAQFQEWWQTGDAFNFGLFLDDMMVGAAGLHRRIGPSALEIGYWVHVDHTGKGLATEAAGALADVALTLDGIERVEIHHDVANPASGRVPEKLGFIVVEEREVPPQAPAETGRQLIWERRRR